MSDNERDINWRKTTFDGSRREQLRQQARAMTIHQRFEVSDQLTELASACGLREKGAVVQWLFALDDSLCDRWYFWR